MPTLKILSKDQGERLDVLLARAYPKYSRSFLQKVMKSGGVLLAGTAPSPSYRVRAGEVFHVRDFEAESAVDETSEPAEALKPAARNALKGQPVPTILFEDGSLLAINKPAGLVVHPAPSFTGATLIDWLRHHLGGKIAKIFTDPERLGLVHRLDKDTSGVLLIAKSVTAQIALSRQFRDRTLKKVYAAFVEGIPEAKKGVITAPIGRSQKLKHRMAISSYGRPSETAFEVKETYKEASLLTLYPKTGRTHQIRVHLAAIGHPIVGDYSYGARLTWSDPLGVKRPLLHAERLEVAHPETGKRISFEAPWPSDFSDARRRIKAYAKTLSLCFLVFGLCLGPLSAEEAAPKKSTKSKSSSTGSNSSANSTASAVKTVQRQLASLESAMSAFSSQVEELQGQFEELGAARRLHDLEKAVSEINAKAVSSAATTDETKTQMLEATRKLRSLQESVDTMRDQIDRLQREVIQRRTQLETTPHQ